MSYVQEQQPASTQAQPTVNETTGAGPVATAGGTKSVHTPNMRRVPLRSRLEKIGFWVIVAAALALLVVLLGIFLPRIMEAMFTAFFAGLFVGILTTMNLPTPSAWGNSLLGRKLFPVIQAAPSDILRLSWINGLMVFIFTFVFQLIASFVGPIFGGLLVFVGLIAAGMYYIRVRSVVIKP